MSGTVAIVLPPGPTSEQAATLVRRLHLLPSRFRSVVLGPQGTGALAEIVHRPIRPAWLPTGAQHRYALRAADHLARLRPAVIEVHDAPEVANLLGGRFRPTPVVLVLHTDPQAQRGAHDPAARTFLLAQATRVAALSPDLRARLLDGVHPAMRHCTLLPPPDGPEGPQATADALDALRLDALKAWSRTLHGPI
jgi:UDP-glucose:(glucosyl)LPS alpha-1,2-glucosyltransferase